MSEVLERVNGSAFHPDPAPPEILVTAVPYDFLAEEFMRTGPLMAKVAQTTHGRFEVEDLFEACVERRMTLWVAVRLYENRRREYLAVIFTSIRDYPRRRAFRVDFVAGVRLTEWLGRFAQAFQEAARIEGCDLLEGGGRSGWGRVLKRIGMRPAGYFFQVEASHA